MKKTLLFTVMLAATLCAAAAPVLKAQKAKAPVAPAQIVDATTDNSFWFGYSGDIAGAIGQDSQSCYYAGAMRLSPQRTAELQGLTIEAISFGVGTKISGASSVFITNSLKEAPIYQQEFTPSNATGMHWETVQLDKAVEITSGVELYVGFVIQGKGYLVGVDYMTSSMCQSDFVALGELSTKGDFTKFDFVQYGSQFGNACIRMRLSGDAPAVCANVVSVAVPPVVSTVVPFSPNVIIKNMGAYPITSVYGSCSIGNINVEGTYTLEQPIAPGEFGMAPLGEVTADATGSRSLSISLTAINGVDIDPFKATTTVTGSLLSTPRMMVVEEATSTGCGFCPRGIAALSYMKENYPERFIGIGVHCTGQGDDPMIIKSYNTLGSYFEGLPACFVNRNSSLATDPNTDDLKSDYINYFGIPGAASEAEIKIEAEWATVERSAIKVKTATTFGLDKYSAKCAIALVLIENKVGPYNQKNYYTGGSYGPCGGWESKGSSVSWMFDDVARYINAFNGASGSLPANVLAGQTYEYEEEIPVFGLTNYFGDAITVNPENVEVIAMVVCTNPRAVIQAVKIDASEIAENTSGLHWQQIVMDQQFDPFYAPGTELDLQAYATSGLPVAYEITSGADIASIDGSRLTMRLPGSVTIKATQAGNDNYMEAAPVTFTVVCKNPQEITWDQDLSGIRLNEEFPLEATATSGLPVTFKLKTYTSGVKIKSGAITFTKEATVTVVASQEGDNTFGPAPKVEREITCTDSGIETISLDDIAGALVFDLGGIHVDEPRPGHIYIVVSNLKARKVLVK